MAAQRFQAGSTLMLMWGTNTPLYWEATNALTTKAARAATCQAIPFHIPNRAQQKMTATITMS